NPADFTLILSASVMSMKGVSGLQFSGSIEGVRIRPSLLLQGKFPVIGIDSFGVTISGNLFGGQVHAGLLGGILKIAFDGTNYSITDSNDENQIFARVLFVAVQGGFDMAGLGGFNIQFAMSELGPLGLFISASVPGGILLEPNTGLSINDFAAGVDFF